MPRRAGCPRSEPFWKGSKAAASLGHYAAGARALASPLLWCPAVNRPLHLTPTFVFVTVSVLAACTDSSVTSSESDGGSEGPLMDSPSTTDSPATDATACSSEASVVSCCCEGDLQATPSCGSDGTLTCAAGYGLYHGPDCSCPAGHGPCCGGTNLLDASDAADAPPTDSSLCVSPEVLRFETAGCGAAAHPVCGSSAQDACFGQVCGCEGTTLSKCDYATAAWSHLGPCGDAGEGGADAADQ